MSPERSWVLIGSSNGSSNHGDESMWRATAAVLRGIEPASKLITDAWPGWTPPLAHVEVLPFLHNGLLRRSAPPRSRAEAAANLVLNRGATKRGYARQDALVGGAPVSGSLEVRWDKAIRESQGLIFCGAGGMTDRFALHAIAGWGLLVALAHRHGVPIAFLGQGIGPVVDPRARRSLRTTLELSDVVVTRDVRSEEEAMAIAPRAQVIAAPDWALLDVPTVADRSRAAAVLGQLGLSKPFLTASLHDWTSATTEQRGCMVQMLGRVAGLAASHGMSVLLVPNCTGGKRADDRTFMALAREGLPPQTRRCVVVLNDRLTSPVIRAVIGHSAGLFSSRYHPVIFALAEGVAATGLCYDPYYVQKHKGALAWYGEQARVWQVGDPAPTEGWLAAGVDVAELRSRQRLERTAELVRLVREPLITWLGSVTARA